jgi:ABC-type multidrug transport system ATPase subunit
MLSGLFASSEGEAELFGTNMFSHMKKARQVMGVCP